MSLSKIDLQLADLANCEVLGFLYASDDSAELSQDMVEVHLPNGINISGGWYPEGSPAGHYVIKAWGRDDLPDDMYPKDAHTAAKLIRDLVTMFIADDSEPIADQA